MKKIPAQLEAEIVRLHFAEKIPVCELARLVGVHHDVVRRVLQSLSTFPANLAPRPTMLDPYREWIVETLNSYPKMTGSRIFAMLQERGYTGGVSRVRDQLMALRPRPAPEAFLRLKKLAGEEAQVDWGHFGKMVVGRTQRPLVAFVMVLAHSRAIYLRFFHDAKMANFLAGHNHAFRYFNGVARKALYDNLKSAVLEREGNIKRFHPTLFELAKHYRFAPEAAAPARGNEKGRVERGIRYVRDSFFAAREWKDLATLNDEALTWCQTVALRRPWQDDRTRTVGEVFEEERSRLLPLPGDVFPAHDRLETRVGKTPYIRFDGNDYSVPHHHVRQLVAILADESRVRVLANNVIVADHVRSYSKGETSEEAAHIADLVDRKRQARSSSATSTLLNAAPAAQHWLELASTRGSHLGYLTRRLKELLGLYGAVLLNACLLELNPRESLHLSSLIQLLETRQRGQGRHQPLAALTLPSARLAAVVVRPHSVESYAELEREGSHDEAGQA
ncbi:MAG: hypothetical protein RL033_6663 [Pseudomonadota bacterium]|jgi:transposase